MVRQKTEGRSVSPASAELENTRQAAIQNLTRAIEAGIGQLAHERIGTDYGLVLGIAEELEKLHRCLDRLTAE